SGRATTWSTPRLGARNEPATVPRELPRLRRFAARHLVAFAVWNRRHGPFGHCLDRPASPRGTDLLAGPAIGADGLWRFAVPGPVLVCRQRALGQPRLADRGRAHPR